MVTSLAFLGSIGWQELLIVLGIVLLIFGPKNLPKLSRMMGRSLREFRSAADKAGDDEEEDEQPKDRRKEQLEEGERGEERKATTNQKDKEAT